MLAFGERLATLLLRWHEDGALGLLPEALKDELLEEAPVAVTVLNVPASGSLVGLSLYMARRLHRRVAPG